MGGDASVNSSKHTKDLARDSEGHDNSRAASTSNGETEELEFPGTNAM